jgi:hypothetical protein
MDAAIAPFVTPSSADASSALTTHHAEAEKTRAEQRKRYWFRKTGLVQEAKGRRIVWKQNLPRTIAANRNRTRMASLTVSLLSGRGGENMPRCYQRRGFPASE